MDYLKKADKEIFEAVKNEIERQATKLELIASENFVSRAVLDALGSPLTNKYAEGYPYQWEKNENILDYEKYGRYYGGCEYVDVAERLAIERAKKLFGAEHVNVQPHSGSQANLAAFFTLANPGDTIMGLKLTDGGHLTHGHPVNFSGRFFNVVQYGVEKGSEVIDYDHLAEQIKEVKPKILIAGASAYPRTLDFKRLREIADSVNAYLVVDMAHIAGLIAAGLHPSPVPYADIVTTTTHKTLRGPRGGMVMCKIEHAKELDKNVFPGMQGGPLMHVIAAKAVSFGEALTDEFKNYQKQIIANAQALARALQDEGMRLVSGGTDTHLLLIDLGPKGTGPSGKKIERLLDKANITVNKNTIPFDTRSPFLASGVRIGTPAVTTRGMKEEEMKIIAKLLAKIIKNYKNEDVIAEVGKEVTELCAEFPLYKELLETCN